MPVFEREKSVVWCGVVWCGCGVVCMFVCVRARTVCVFELEINQILTSTRNPWLAVRIKTFPMQI